MLRRNIFLRAATDAAAALPAGRPQEKCWYRNHMMTKRLGGFRSRWGSGSEGVNTGVHLQNQTLVHCVDNTNCKHVRLIGPVNSERTMHHRVLPAVAHRVSVLRFKSGRSSAGRQKVKPGSMYWICLLSRRQYHTRWSGMTTTFDRNTCIIMNDQRVPLGTRVMYCSGRHVNHKLHLKAAVMANFFV